MRQYSSGSGRRRSLNEAASFGTFSAMIWIKKGRLFDPAENRNWVFSHAQVPTPFLLGDRVRVFYADRNAEGKSFPRWVDVARENPLHVIGAGEGSVLPFGDRGAFDDEGIMPGDIVRRESRLWMYYTGWNQGVTVPYRNSIGLAYSDDDGKSFSRAFAGPVVDRAFDEPLMSVTPFIL